jgi:hypothetical protein
MKGERPAMALRADKVSISGPKARGGGIEVGGQLGDLVAEPVQLRGEMPTGKHS